MKKRNGQNNTFSELSWWTCGTGKPRTPRDPIESPEPERNGNQPVAPTRVTPTQSLYSPFFNFFRGAPGKSRLSLREFKFDPRDSRRDWAPLQAAHRSREASFCQTQSWDETFQTLVLRRQQIHPGKCSFIMQKINKNIIFFQFLVILIIISF